MEFLSPADHIKEQAVWRMSQIEENSSICMRLGYCTFCGCSINEKVFEDRACEGEPPCYPEMMDAQAWEDFKAKNNITIEL